MQVFTSSWFADLPDTIQKIGISRGTPRGYKAGYRKLGILSPGPWFNSVGPERYMELFCAQVLKPLDIDALMKRLEELGNGKDVALLCYERPPFNMSLPGGKHNYCHRRAVSSLLQAELGISVPEWGTTEDTIGIGAEQWVDDMRKKFMAIA